MSDKGVTLETAVIHLSRRLLYPYQLQLIDSILTDEAGWPMESIVEVGIPFHCSH